MSYTEVVNSWVAKKVAKTTKKIDPKAAKALVDTYEAFLRVGRVNSIEWSELDTDEKACMLMAQKRIDIETAMRFAMALKAGGSEELMAELDGGLAKIRRVVDVAVTRYIEKQK